MSIAINTTELSAKHSSKKYVQDAIVAGSLSSNLAFSSSVSSSHKGPLVCSAHLLLFYSCLYIVKFISYSSNGICFKTEIISINHTSSNIFDVKYFGWIWSVWAQFFLWHPQRNPVSFALRIQSNIQQARRELDILHKRQNKWYECTLLFTWKIHCSKHGQQRRCCA